jgi:hypothetical protein
MDSLVDSHQNLYYRATVVSSLESGGSADNDEGEEEGRHHEHQNQLQDHDPHLSETRSGRRSRGDAHFMDDNNGYSLISIDEGETVLFGLPQGARMGRMYRKSSWSLEEMLALQVAKREDRERHGSNSNSHHNHNLKATTVAAAQERWNWIEDYCWALGVQRSAQQCHDKWEGISTAFKKVYNHDKLFSSSSSAAAAAASSEVHKKSSSSSYWQMSGEERKKHKLPANFPRELFMAVMEWQTGKSSRSSVDPGELVVDTSTPVPIADLTESDDESDDDISGPNRTMGKRRKLGGPKIEATLANILEHNSQTVVEAMMELEERQDKRHREDLELEKRKLAMEKENFSHMMKLSTGYISALNSIGDGLKQLSTVLTGNAHSLHFPQAL